MGTKPVVSIIGRPNVGKSSLFNRILAKRVAVVDDFPGVTRDRNYMDAFWNGKDFTLVDTGGLIPNVHSELPKAIHDQVDIAVRESAVVIFLVEAGTGVTDLDLLISRQLRRNCTEKVVLVVNKAESFGVQYELHSYLSLGFGKPFAISAIHGKGVADLLDEIAEKIEDFTQCEEQPDDEHPEIRVALVGRPNAGKSSIVNRLLGSKRMIVDSIPGTTRDAIDSEMEFDGKTVILIDTAGLRKKSHVKKDVEYYSNLRAMNSIERCDICILVVDVSSGIGVQDMRILRKVAEKRKGMVLAWNKWDIHEKDHRTFDQLTHEARSQFKELKNVPMISVSALTGKRISNLIEEAFTVRERMKRRIPQSEFENKIFEWVRTHPHPVTPSKTVRFLGAKQFHGSFPLFRFFVTNPELVSPSYSRFLLNKINETYDFCGCPVVLEFRPVRSKHSAVER